MIILSILGCVLIISQSNNIIEHISRMSWNKTEALIIKSEITGERAIRPQIEYSYLIDSISYRGETDLDVPMFGGKRKKYDVASELIKGFHTGDTIMIFYNPNKPEASFYKSQIKWNIFAKLALGTLFLGIGIFFSSFYQKQLF